MDTKPEDGAAGGGVGGTLKTNLESTLGTEFDKNGNLTSVELSNSAQHLHVAGRERAGCVGSVG